MKNIVWITAQKSSLTFTFHDSALYFAIHPPRHPDAATPQQATFKRMVRRMIRAMGLLGFKAFFEDEAGAVTGMRTGKGYYKKGSKPIVQIP